MASGGNDISGVLSPCSPCEKRGINTVSMKYCVDCKEYYCRQCLTKHKAVKRKHKVVDQCQPIQELPMPTKQCPRHGGLIIEYYCPKDDTVGCSTCMNLDHSKCGRQFIPQVAIDFKESIDLKELEKDIKSLQKKFDFLKNQKTVHLGSLLNDKDTIHKQIQTVRGRINDQLDTMQRELLDNAKEMFKQRTEAISREIEDIHRLLEDLKLSMERINAENDSDKFISCKGKKRDIVNELYPKLQEEEDIPPEPSLELHVDEHVQKIMAGAIKFASLMEKYAPMEEMQEICKQYIKLDDDETECSIRSMCSLEDGTIIMADLCNKKLKKYDPVSTSVSTLIDLPDTPVGLCHAGGNHLAVSLINTKTIQFVLLGDKVVLDHSFQVGDRCRGLAYCDGWLYVCCGGSPDPTLEEGAGHVEVYSCDGELLRCLYERIGWPKYISVANIGYTARIYISDETTGITVRDTYIHGTSKVLNVTSGRVPFCLVGSGQMAFGECFTEKLYAIQTNGTKSQKKSCKDLKNKPLALYFDETSLRLFVTSDACNFIKVFGVIWRTESDTSMPAKSEK